MSVEHNPDEQVGAVRFEDERLIVDLADGRPVVVPLEWYPRLENATPEQRTNWEVSAAGCGIHWPGIDEDLSTNGLLKGIPAPGRRAA